MSVNIQTSDGLVKIAGTPTIDTSFSNISKNPVQNNVITQKFEQIDSQIRTQNSNLSDLKILGWSVPSECPVQNYVDSDGVFHQRVGRVDLGSLNWSYNSTYKIFNSNTPTDATIQISGGINIFANKYTRDIFSILYYNLSLDKRIFCNDLAYGSNTICVRDLSYTDDVTAFKNAMKGVYLYYELAKEITTSVDGNEAVTQIKNDLEWKLLADNVAVGTSTNVVGGAREYYVVAKYGTINITTLIPSIVLGKTIFDGHYSSASDNSRIQINTTTSALSLVSFIYVGSVKDDETYAVYYR